MKLDKREQLELIVIIKHTYKDGRKDLKQDY